MSDTTRNFKTIALDIGNGYCKINHPATGKFESIPAYVAPVFGKGIDDLFLDHVTSYRLQLPDQPMLVVGDAAKTLEFDGDTTSSNGLWEVSKDEYYLHFLASLFVGLPRGVTSITIDRLLVTVQPKPSHAGETQCERNAKTLATTHNFWVAGRSCTLVVKEVETYAENRATAFLVASTCQPSEPYVVVQFGKGTTHIQAYGTSGQAMGETMTIHGMARLMVPLQRRIREATNNLSPSMEELTHVIASGKKTITVGPKALKIAPLLSDYKKGFAAKLDQCLDTISQRGSSFEFSSIFLAGGAVSLASAWKREGIARDWQPEDIEPQFIELQGLLEIAKVRK